MPLESDVYFHVPGVASVRWDGTSQLVHVEWEGWANSAEFVALLDAEVRALIEHRGSRLLADCRRQRVLSPVDQDTADREWLPRVLAAGLKRFAIVLPTSALAAMNLEDRLGKIPGTTLEVAYFEGIAEARTWITRRG
jgi:SpoIIAA-like